MALEPDALGGVREAAHAVAELGEGSRRLGIAIVEAVGEGLGHCADGGHVAHRLGDRIGRAPVGADVTVEGIAVHRQRAAGHAALQRRADSGARFSRPDDRVALHLCVVGPVDVGARADVGMAEDLEQGLLEVRHFVLGFLAGVFRQLLLSLIGDAACDLLDRRIADDDPAMLEGVGLLLQHAADDTGPRALVDVGQVPVIVVDAQDLVGEMLRHGEHETLLGLGAHDDLREHIGQGHVHGVEVELDAEAARGADLRAPAGQPAAADVLQADGDVKLLGALANRLVRLPHAQDVLEERVGDLDGAPVVLLLLLVEDLGGKGTPAEARIIRGLPDEDDHVWLVLRLGRHGRVNDVLLGNDTQRHDVHQAVVIEGLIEVDIAREARNPQRIAVLPDALDDTVHDPFRAVGVLAVRVAEAQGIGAGDDPRAHAVHIAHDAADAGGGALIRQHL